MENKKVMHKDKKGSKQTNDKSFVAAALKGTGMGLIITCIIFIIFAFVLTYTDISDSYTGIVSTVCTALSAIVCGYVWAKGRGKDGLLIGMLAGLVYCVILLIVSFIAGGGPLSMGTLTCLVVALAGGGIGGIFGVNKK